MNALDISALDFEKGGGSVTVVAQHANTGAVLMVAYANREALEKSVETREMHFLSRTRGLWRKGETSGNTLRVVELIADCDADAVLARVIPKGPTCHTGQSTCFGEPTVDAIRVLEDTIRARADVAGPGAASYTQRLLADRNLRLKKIGEEATELVVALADGDKLRAAEEAADVLYHLMVGLQAAGVPFDEIRAVLARRHKR